MNKEGENKVILLEKKRSFLHQVPLLCHRAEKISALPMFGIHWFHLRQGFSFP